jgi:hypothetical protein
MPKMRAEPQLLHLAYMAARLEDSALEHTTLDDLIADGHGSSFPSITVVVGGSSISGRLIGPRTYGQLVIEWADRHGVKGQSLGLIQGAFSDIGPISMAAEDAMRGIHSIYLAEPEIVLAGEVRDMPPTVVPMSAVDAWCLGAPGYP